MDESDDHKLLLLLGQKKAHFIFRDEFRDDRAAGAINGTLSTDGKATRTVLDTDNTMTMNGGYLVYAGSGTTPTDPYRPGLWEDLVITRAAGVALFSSLISYSGNIHPSAFDSNKTFYSDVHSFRFVGTSLEIYDNAASTVLGTIALDGTEYKTCIILRSTGAFYFIKGGGFTSWTLIYVSNANSTASLYAQSCNYNANALIGMLRVAQLPAPWTDDYGIATQRLVGEIASGTKFTHMADCLIEWMVTTMPGAGKAISARLRWQDVSNFWEAVIGSDGSITLGEVIGGSSTNRGSVAAGSISNGQRMMVVAEGSTIKVYANNVLVITYTSAINYATCTTGLLAKSGGVISDIVSWPRVLPFHLQSMLNGYAK